MNAAIAPELEAPCRLRHDEARGGVPAAAPRCRVCEGGGIPAEARVSRFCGQSGVEEYYFTVRPTQDACLATQLDWLECAYRGALDACGIEARTALFRRFFCSDLSNQAAALEARALSDPRGTAEPCAVSWVSQAPLTPAKVALYAYHVREPGATPDIARAGSCVSVRRGQMAHHWATGLARPQAGTLRRQTQGILEDYDAILRARGLSLADNAIRTWFFLRDIDRDYREFAAARREFFARHGLTPQTHFIASTGIEGGHVDPRAAVAMDAYAISGVRPGQIAFLAAPDHLSPTHIYGVTFERGTAVAYRDRKHIILSGTASIDAQGNILYPGDLARQLDRSVENVEALLRNAGAGLRDMAAIVGYVRDTNDQAPALRRLEQRFPATPTLVLLAPVCRPGWLVEIEGTAILPAANPGLPPF